MKEILFIAYFFKEEDGVGAFRSIFLAKFLEEKGFTITPIIKKSFGSFASRNIFLWGFFCFINILNSKEKMVYVSCGPFLHLPFIYLAAKMKRKRLIVDFRDPWSLNIKDTYGKGTNQKSLKLSIAETVEKKLYNYCSFFVVCTEGMFEQYSTLFQDNTKLKLIHNGHVLSDEIIEKKSNPTENMVRFICLGKFAEYSIDKAKAAFEKVRKIKDNGVAVELNFVGSEAEITSKLAQEAGLEKETIIHPRMKYEAAVKLASTCDVGLLIIRNENFDMGTKVFDYIGMGLPLLDIFEKNKPFAKRFNKYFFEDKVFEIPLEDRIYYKRENRVKEFIKIFNKA